MLGILLICLIAMGACGMACVGLMGGTGVIMDDAERAQKEEAAAALLPEVKTFLDAHKEFGVPILVESMPDWEQEKRQKVTLNSAGDQSRLLFYVKGSEVVSVYEDGRDGTERRNKVWGDFSVDDGTSRRKR